MTLGILKYLAQINNSEDCVSEENRFRFSGDLSVFVIVNLLTISSFNIRGQFAYDIPGHNQSFLQSEVSRLAHSDKCVHNQPENDK